MPSKALRQTGTGDQRQVSASVGAAVARVTVNGQGMEGWGLESAFSTVNVSYRWDGIPHADLVYSPVTAAFVGAEILANGNRIDIWIGYPRARGLESIYMGPFVIEHSELLYREGASPALRLSCYGAGVNMTREERRRAFRNRRDSDIATEIAAEYDLQTEDEVGAPTIEATPYLLNQVTQAGETDLEFLRRRADLYGYQCFTCKRRLYFRLPRLGKPVVTFGAVGAVPIVSFQGGPDSVDAGMRYTNSDFDPVTGELVTLTSDGRDNEVLVQMRAGIASGTVRTPEEIVGGSYDRFVLGAGHQVDTKRVRTHIRGMAKKGAYISDANVVLGVMPHVQPMDTVELFASGRFGGPYLVSSVTHEISADAGKHSIINLTRSFELSATPLEKLVGASTFRGQGESGDIDIVIENTQDQG